MSRRGKNIVGKVLWTRFLKENSHSWHEHRAGEKRKGKFEKDLDLIRLAKLYMLPEN